MKKSGHFLIVLFMMAAALLFASCQISSDPYDNGSSTDDSSSSGTDTSSSSTDTSGDDTTDSGTTDTIGTSWGTLFANTGHNPIDLQIWQNYTSDISDTSSGQICTITDGSTWFGGAIVQSSSAAPTSCVYYDMSSVAKVTFEVKASAAGTIWVGYSSASASDALDKKTGLSVTTDWQTVTLTQAGVAKAWSIFAFGGEPNVWATNATICFKNITYYDASGNSIALLYAK